MRLEHEAGVIVEVAHKGGAKADILDSRPPGGDEAVAHLEGVKRRGEVEPGGLGQAPKRDRRLVGIAGNGEERFQHRALLGCDRLARPQRSLLEKPVGDLAGAAPADRLDAGDRQKILDQRLGAGVVGAFERRQHACLRQRALARPAEDGVEAAPAGDAAAEAAAPHVGNFKRFKHAVEEARVADPRGEHAAPRRRRRLKAQREHFGVCRLGVLAAEALEPGLRLLAVLARPSAEHRAEIGIFSDGAGPVRIEIGAADGNRIFRPQAQLLARGAGGEEQAAADLLARHVEEDSRRMQDRRFGPLEPGGEKMIERALAGAARRLAHGIGKGRRFNGRGHRMALMVGSAPFNKAASSAQPFSRGKVNAELAREG